MTGNMLIHDGAGAVPTTAQLSTKQVGVNTADATIFVNNGSNIVEIGSAGWSAACQTKAQFEASRDANTRAYPASGFSDWGNVPGSSTHVHHINNGMYTSTNEVNSLFMGVTGQPPGQLPSDTHFARSLVSGVVSGVYGIHRDPSSSYNSTIMFPPAPDGLTTYNANTGASVRRSTLSESFGAIHWSSIAANGTGAVWDETTGICTRGSSTVFGVTINGLATSRTQISVKLVTSSDCTVEIKDGPGGSDTTIYSTSAQASFPVTFEFNAARSNPQMYIRIDNASAGQTLQILKWEARDAGVSPVLNRTDMFGGEYFLREVTKADPFVYPKGCIQSRQTEMNGVATAFDTTHPITYFQQYENQPDVNIRGRGVDFWAAWTTNADRLSIVNDISNNLYYEGGRLYQFCLRIRTVAGVDNGGWGNVDAAVTAEYGGSFIVAKPVGGANSFFQAQGTRDSSAVFAGAQRGYTSNYNNKYTSSNASRGLFAIPGKDSATCIDGECYFQVWGLVPRINQGAYHPEFNDAGSALMRTSGGSWVLWSNSALTGGHAVHSAYECFRGMPYTVGGSLTDAGAAYSGSGRPDSRYHDAIYDSGIGGVDDYRVTCKDTGGHAHASNAILDAMRGVYRGAERLRKTVVCMDTDHNTTSAGIKLFNLGIDMQYLIGKTIDKVHIWYSGAATTITRTQMDSQVILQNGTTFVPYITLKQNVARHPTTRIVVTFLEDTVVSGEFTHTDVLGEPDRVAIAIPEGWYGEWIREIPNGSTKEFYFTRPMSSTAPIALAYTNDRGSSWTVANGLPSLSRSSNSYAFAEPSSLVYLISYRTLARVTEPIDTKPVLGGEAGLGSVVYSSYHQDSFGRSLGFSLTNAICRNTVSGTRGSSALTSGALDGIGMLSTMSQYRPLHYDIRLLTPNNQSHGFKALWSQCKDSYYSTIQFCYGELIHNGSNWGDDGNIHVYSQDASHQNTNGTTVKAGTHKLVKPLGYTW